MNYQPDTRTNTPLGNRYTVFIVGEFGGGVYGIGATVDEALTNARTQKRKRKYPEGRLDIDCSLMCEDTKQDVCARIPTSTNRGRTSIGTRLKTELIRERRDVGLTVGLQEGI